MKNKKLAVLKSVISLLLCVSMLAGTTFAWFTDSVRSGKNSIVVGALDVELEYLDADNNWQSVTADTNVFAENTLWEPGHTEVVYLRVSNAGTLALKYQLGINIAAESGSVNVAGEEFVLSDYIEFGAIEDVQTAFASRAAARAAVTNARILSTGYTQEGELLAGDPADYVAFVVYMPETVDNAANYRTGELPPRIELGISLFATQTPYETDSFGADYDWAAGFPEVDLPAGGKVDVTVENGATASDVTISGGNVSAEVPAGVQVEDGTTELSLSVTEMSASGSNVTLATNEVLKPVDVHVSGVSATNTTPMKVRLDGFAAIGLNEGNLKLYHVENGETTAMTRVSSEADFSAHNQFTYDPATGNIVLYLASFSEVAMVADTENAWNGEFDYKWYDASKNEFVIANADQLAAFGAIVGGMNGQTQDSFSGKTVKLISNVNLGDADDAGKDENNKPILFYPIGYYNDAKSYTKPTDGTATAANVTSFCGTFDGNGHTIANFYQNTWQMWGNYDGNNYKAAMGLFGYVYGGTIKNLTVDHFSSDGEYTPTGVIAAYAVNSTFENIAITNCNPRVYNTGNGGIIGIAGREDASITESIALKNITVDNSNKISALWGSYDVACGGLVGMYRGNVDSSEDTISFENCHVSAQIDVYNDVCANYQYYAYRYSGMIIGSVRHNTTNAEGKTIPNMTGISASGCTVNFGDWNDYYYCELVANTTASYTHDHQMSRLTQIQKIDTQNKKYLPLGKADETGNWVNIPSGRVNYVVVNSVKPDGSFNHASANARCYHFVDGTVWDHTNAGYHDGNNGEKFIDENNDGKADLKEDKQHLYLEFNNLFTGYGWGVSSMGIDKWNGIEKLDVELGDYEKSVEKFEGKVTELANSKEYKLGDIFAFVDNGVELVPSSLTVAVTNLDESNPVSATVVYDQENWENGTLILSGTGDVKITIQDYYFCTPTTIEVTITDRKAEEKFDIVMNNGDFLHRVGNQGTVPLDKLFKAKDGVTVGTVSVTVEAVDGTVASGTYTSNETWTSSTIQFSGTGVVKVTIKDDDAYCTPTVLTLEVVDATNVSGASNATSNNVVLLNNCGFSSLEVSGGYTLYGNGFTMTCSSDSPALDTGYSFVTLNDGTLDNVQIVCPNFDYAVLYKSNLDSMPDDRKQTTDRTRYYNVKSGVMVSGNSQILNSRISGARAAVNVTGGNVLIDNSRIELGAVATILVGAANSLTLRDVTLVQKPTASTYDSSKTLMGFSVLFVCDADGNTAPVTLEETLVQNAWVNEDYKQYVPSDGQSIISTVLGKTEYLHDLNGDGEKESLNLGFAYMPESATSKVNATTITDNRTNKNDIPYDYAEVSILTGKTYVYSYKNTNGTDDAIKKEDVYVPDAYGDIITVIYSDTADGLESGKSFGTSGWVYELNVDLDKVPGYALDFSKLTMSVNGTTVSDYKVNGNAKPTSPVAVTAGGTSYTLTATIDDNEYTATYKVTGTETSKESPSKISGPTAAGFGVAKSYGGDWSGAADVLTGVKVKYWSVAENKYVEFDFSNFTVPGNAGKLNGTNSYWEYTHTNNDFTLKVTNTVAIHSGKSVYGMPIRGTDGKLYFTISSTNGYVGSGTTSRAITMQYEFTDNNGGEKLTFTHTFNISYNKDDQYSYSDLSGSGKLTKLEDSSGGGCVTPDTLITLADGTQKRIDQVSYADKLLVWDFYNGEYAVVPSALIVNHGWDNWTVIELSFDDGTVVKAITAHAFFDKNTNAWELIDAENATQYIGHEFVKEAGNGYTTAKLVDVKVYEEYTESYSLVSSYHYNFITEGMFSLTNSVFGMIAGLEVGENMTYDVDVLRSDLEKYGRYTYNDFVDYISYKQYIAFNGDFLKISVGKGYITFEEILDLIETYLK